MESMNVLKKKILNGGTYDQIRVFDQLHVTSKLQCENLIVYNEATFDGELFTKKLILEGMATFNELVKALDLHIKGSGYFNHELQANSIQVLNEIRVENKVLANHIELNGIANIKAIDAASLILKGTLNCDLLRSNQINMIEKASGHIHELVGSIITIQPIIDSMIKIDKILAYEVNLENVSVDYIQTKKIMIGKNCHIGQIVYL